MAWSPTPKTTWAVEEVQDGAVTAASLNLALAFVIAPTKHVGAQAQPAASSTLQPRLVPVSLGSPLLAPDDQLQNAH